MKKTEKVKVLIIDDDQDLLDMYILVFEAEGFEVHTEKNGLNGLVKAVQIKPMVILIDLMMPQMDGFETIRAFRKNTSMDVILVTFSNLNQQSDIDKAIEYGSDAFLVKSNYTPSDVVEEVKKMMIKKEKG
jgi:two-component system alkaline phosphatase synthesis response regulator PhoP